MRVTKLYTVKVSVSFLKYFHIVCMQPLSQKTTAGTEFGKVGNTMRIQEVLSDIRSAWRDSVGRKQSSVPC